MKQEPLQLVGGFNVWYISSSLPSCAQNGQLAIAPPKPNSSLNVCKVLRAPQILSVGSKQGTPGVVCGIITFTKLLLHGVCTMRYSTRSDLLMVLLRRFLILLTSLQHAPEVAVALRTSAP